MGSLTLKIIDAHAMLGLENHLVLDADELLHRMDDHGVERALAHTLGAELVVDNRAGNDRLFSSGPRIQAMITVNPWFGRRALDEMQRCRDRGAVGLYLHPSRQGFLPTEPVIDPVMELAGSFHWPVMFHTGSYIHSDALAVGEVARRYPQITFIAGFGGFTDNWFELPGLFAEVSNLVLDASMIWCQAVDEVIRHLGAQRVLFGSAEPRNRYAAVIKSLNRLELDEAQRRAVFHENALRIFNLS